jgi:hypothetical protein
MRPFAKLRNWLGIDYVPHPEERPFLERAQTRREGEIEATVAVPSDRESEWIFGVKLAHHELQAVWLEVANGGVEPLWLNRVQLDPNYYTPLEAAHMAHFAMATRLVAFGVLGWLFLPLLLFVPIKLIAARNANQQLRRLFRSASFPTGIIPPGRQFRGFLFTPLDEGTKRVDIRLLGRYQTFDFAFTVEVPGLMLPHPSKEVEPATGAEELDEAALQAWLERQPRCTSNARATMEGDPLNLVIVSDRASIQECLGAWDETESNHISHRLENGPGFPAGVAIPLLSGEPALPLWAPAGFRPATRPGEPQPAYPSAFMGHQRSV